MSPLITYDLLRQHVSHTFLEQGMRYLQAGRVDELEVRDDVREVVGAVDSGRHRPFQAEIHLRKNRAGEPFLDTVCTCPRGSGCKHVAAVGLSYLEGDPALEELVQETGSAEEGRRFQAWERELAEALDAGESGFTPPPWRVVDEPPVEGEALYFLVEAAGCDLNLRLLRGDTGKEGERRPCPPYHLRQIPLATADPMAHRLLEGVGALAPRGGGQRIPLTPGAGGWLITHGLASGRLLINDGAGSPARPGPPRLLGVALVEEDGYRFRFTPPPSQFKPKVVPDWPYRHQGPPVSEPDPGLRPLPTTPPLYLDETTGEVGLLFTPVPPLALCFLMASPSLTPSQAERFTAHWGGRTWQARGRFPRPVADTAPWVDGGPPVTHLRLVEVPSDRPGELIPQVEAHLSFVYGGAKPVPYGTAQVPREVRDGREVRLRRNREAEESAADALRFEGLSEELLDEGRPLFIQRDIADHVDFCRHLLPELKALGWVVEEVLTTLKVTHAEAEVQGEIQTESDGFTMDLSFGVGEERVDLTPLLQGYLEGEQVARTSSGELFPLPAPQLDKVLSLLEEIGESDLSQPLRLPRYQAAQLEELEEAANLAGDQSWRELSAGLRNFRQLEPVAPPAGLQADLRHYQLEGVAWLNFLRQWGLHGILADDMGLGKTIQALALLLMEKEAGRLDRPSLVVVPTSLVFNWEAEAKRFAPELKVLPLHGSGRKRRFDRIDEADIILTTYGLLRWDKKLLVEREYHYVILDEAQAIKNERTQVARLVRLLKARHRLTMTGTPMENHLGELWSQFAFLMPDFLGSRKRFSELFRKPIEKATDPEAERPRVARERLARRIRPFVLRRTKSQVAVELPPKTEIALYSELAGDQRELYETVRLAYMEKVHQEIDSQGIQRSQITILDALLRLRQVCCHPRLVKLSAARGIDTSVKMDQLAALIPEAVEEGRRILIFSQFVQFLTIVRGWCDDQAISFTYLDGATRDRQQVVERFQEGETPLFLISLKAGGSGLNLTAADTVIHLDPWWNPAVMDQATDRAHRIGQDKPVQVYNLITRGTVEEKILQLQERKQRLATDLLTATPEGGHQISQEDLEVLFEPLG